MTMTMPVSMATAKPLAGIQQHYPFNVKVNFMQLKVKGDRKEKSMDPRRRVPRHESAPSLPVSPPEDAECDDDEKENMQHGGQAHTKSMAKSNIVHDPDEFSDENTTSMRKRKASMSSNYTDEPDGACSTKKKKKHRKSRSYCVCKGSSFGNMIACDSKKCLDRSNWYHMSCVGLNPSNDPPETWFCPACQERDPAMDDIPENQYRKPVASVTYGEMISHALSVLPGGRGTFKEICDFVEKEYESQLNWKLERKSPVWKSSVRKILFSNMRFRKDPHDKAMFCLAA